jgi:uncharacterized protein with HEPN domain
MAKLRRTVEFWLEQVLWSAARLQKHVEGCSLEEFLEDETRIDAVSWCVSCIGEACGKILEINPEFDDNTLGLEIRQAYAARNRYIHGYFDLDIEQIWDTATQAVPHFSGTIRNFLAAR